jgi:repressor LexA
MNELTDRQRNVYEFLISFNKQYGYPPTMQEIAAHLGVTGNLGVIKHLNALEKKGYIKRSSGSSRGINITAMKSAIRYAETPERLLMGSDDEFSVFLPIVGTVRAGMPQPPVEDIQEYYSIDRNVARSGGTFFLKVKGDSMINASIREGDLALIRSQETAQGRDIVVALVDGEATLKRFYREKDCIRLQPENPDMDAIIIREGEKDVSIVGKVVGIYRPLE